MGGAGTVATIITADYGDSGDGGDAPTQIAKAQFGQGVFYRFEWADESILIHRPTKEFTQQGIAQFYEKDSEFFRIEIATLTSEARYDIIENEVRRICLNYGGGSVYSRLHIDSIKEVPHDFYFVGEGILVATLHLARSNDS